MKTDTRDTHTHIKPNELNALRDTHAHFCFVSDEVEGHTGQKNRENGVRKSLGNAHANTQGILGHIQTIPFTQTHNFMLLYL